MRGQAQLTAAEAAVDHLKVVDADLRFSFGMARVEVRKAVIVEEHCDRDPKEAAYRWHEAIMGVSRWSSPRGF